MKVLPPPRPEAPGAQIKAVKRLIPATNGVRSYLPGREADGAELRSTR